MRVLNYFVPLLLTNLVMTTPLRAESFETFEEVVRRAMCDLDDSDGAKNCDETEREITYLKVYADANVTFVCRDVNFIRMVHNPGTFVIERRSATNGNWMKPVISNETTASINELQSRTTYSFRLHRILANGVSLPEITETVSTMMETVHPSKVTHISVGRPEVDPKNPRRLQSEISFTPANDLSCHYEIMLLEPSNNFQSRDLEEPTDHKTTFANLEFSKEYTIHISASTQRKVTSSVAQATLVTPECLQFHKNLTICAPGVVEGLNATTIHKFSNIYDVKVTWRMPELIPDYYMIFMNPMTSSYTGPRVHNVSGTATEDVFPDVTMSDIYQVMIRAASTGGQGQSIEEHFSVMQLLPKEPEESSDISNVGAAIVTLLASAVLVMGTGIYAYHRHAKRKRNRERSKYFKKIQSIDRKDTALDTIKGFDDGNPDRIGVGFKSLLAPADEYEISPDRLEIKIVLGSGAFGVVRLGSLRDDRGQTTPVAIKMLRDNPSEEDRRCFELEIKIMKSAGQHRNIVSLLGCCTIGQRPLLVVEYCSRGDLQSFLRSIIQKATISAKEAKNDTKTEKNADEVIFKFPNHIEDDMQKSNFVVNRGYAVDQDILCDSDTVTVTDLLNFGRQIATGMEFLSSNRVVHRDLAARNVLVCDDKTVKISDFGLSRDIYQENVYKKQGNGRLPVKWMAIEALTHQVYSTHSDVWSFGILLWEIVTLGCSPYPGIPTNKVLTKLRTGYRMERPANCSVALYNVMLSCWQTKPKDRPTFTALRQELDKLLSVAAENEYLDLNDVSRGTPPDDTILKIPNSCSAYSEHQQRYVNEFEPKIVKE
ncbi:tyrosine-protein kinase receptor torso-like isoform X1 [Neodiprion virginianus]|uniref:tyrosine-protein kinase receptor torso-like isoform X1 n=1 Tax=Neodiprion virginianus TaxID=2961670 RepID=UPI001EE76608|nr:tyrosine-protein kinase receptor torso-like isoform X1 [Neodiprion virginianus]